MKKLITWAAVVALLSILELIYGVNSTGEKVAVVLLSWSLILPPIALAIVKFIASYKPNYYDDIDEHGSEFR